MRKHLWPTGDLDRRLFLRHAGLAALPLLAAAEDRADAPHLIPRQRNPENLEFPFAALDSFLTPNNLFYVRNHFAAPSLDAKAWRLRVAGAVERPLELTLEEVRELPSRSLAVTLECAGNGRSFLVPKTKGVQWDLGAVSTAEWTGVPLGAVLEKAGVRAGAVEVILEGADRGEPGNDPRPPGAVAFARSLPLAKARKPEVLLAWQMNGKELPPEHGYPLRAVVGGWYGMASVKWLTRLVVVERPFRGYWQTVDYAVWNRGGPEPSLDPITDMEPKASIARPAADEVLPAAADYRIHGAAWAGEPEVAKVEVSTDGGKTWAEATLLGKPVPFAWRLWEYTWRRPTTGKHTLLARATDVRGREQPLERDPGRRNYVITHVRPTPVEVR
jgi:DMSO/TMAO reductase YedYZ molybdopterin-dependent catalytic subunit